MHPNTSIYYLASGLSAVVLILAFLAWAQTGGWNLGQLSVYRIFPLFGLWAFSLLWVQYVILAWLYIRGVPSQNLRPYFTISGYAVLACMLLHPVLLAGQLWKDGLGLPPDSYDRYVAAGSRWLVTLGMLSLLIFLAYELHRWFSNRGWWKYVFYASSLGMVLVFYHGLQLGGELMQGWYRVVWWFYGLVLVTALVYIHTRKPLPSAGG